MRTKTEGIVADMKKSQYKIAGDRKNSLNNTTPKRSTDESNKTDRLRKRMPTRNPPMARPDERDCFKCEKKGHLAKVSYEMAW